MTDLSRSLTKLNAQQKLFVVRCAPGKIMGELLRKWNIDVLVFERDTDAYARMRDEEVTRIAGGCGVQVVSISGRTLFDSEEIVKKHAGKPTMSMSQLLKAAEKIDGGEGFGVPRKPLDPPKTLPDPPSQTEMDLSELEKKLDVHDRKQQSQPGWPRVAGLDYNAIQRTLSSSEETQYSSGLMGPDNTFSIPTLHELGMAPASVTTPHRGGETTGLALLAQHISNEEYIATFEKPATAPTAFDPRATTVLSPHMHFGSVSCRTFFWDTVNVIEKRQRAGKHVSKQPVNIPGQLLFRDMYFAAHAAVGVQFGQTVGNPIARFVPWHLQSRYTTGTDGQIVTDGTYTVDDPLAEEYFQRWKHGRTGFPWIDALMRQLKLEGWIHHLGRHAVACFLTRGGCYVSWERGAEVFEEWLIDHEVACNAGNWMWLSCTAFFSQFFRCYSPVAFPKKWDAEGAFVRRYVPELAGFDKRYIYEPQKAPIADQKRWGCLVKGDGSGEEERVGEYMVYPKPMFDFNERRQFCIDQMKKAYDVGIYGDDERVVGGQWKEIFLRDDEGMGWKEEANGVGERGSKRSRGSGEEFPSENGPADHLGEDADGVEHPSKRKAAKSRLGKDGRKQGTLDTMVTRGKTNR